MNDEILVTISRLALSLLIGMLIGLQRQSTDHALAGLRTFALTSLLGSILALLDTHFTASGWILGAGTVALVLLIIISEMRLSKSESAEVGMTTAITLILVLCIGAYTTVGNVKISLGIGIAVAALLHFKTELHWFAERLGAKDMSAIIQFAIFSGIVLPILPNENMGPLGVFNPFNIWLMVVLIVGIGLAGYITYKFFGNSTGILITGILGGVISSTATSVSYARAAKKRSEMASGAATVIVIASSIVFIRMLIELRTVAPTRFHELALPVYVILGASLIATIITLFIHKDKCDFEQNYSNPSEFKSAVAFAVLYTFVLYLLSFTKTRFGDNAMFIIAAVSGLTDVDAITLSTGRLAEQGSHSLSIDTAWRVLVIASISNLIFKSALTAIIGGKTLFYQVIKFFLLPIMCGFGLLFFWGN